MRPVSVDLLIWLRVKFGQCQCVGRLEDAQLTACQLDVKQVRARRHAS